MSDDTLAALQGVALGALIAVVLCVIVAVFS